MTKFNEKLATLASIAIKEEIQKCDPSYQHVSAEKVKEEILGQLDDGEADDVLDEFVTCMFEYESDLIEEFPKSFSVCCCLYTLSDSPIINHRWQSLIAGASNFSVLKVLLDAYDEYRDMGDPWLTEAKEWIGEQIYGSDYDSILFDINSVIENYELTEEDSPVTFRAKAMLESMIG